MQVQAINGMNFKGRSLNFKGENSENKVSDVIKSSAVKVPVVVLLAMNPATLNAAIPTMQETNENNIIMLDAKPEQEIDKATYVISPELQQVKQSEYPFGWRLFAGGLHQIKMSMPAKGNGADYHLIFTATKEHPNDISYIYLVKDGQKGSSEPAKHPPEVQKIVFHNLGKSSENFCSVRTTEHLIGKDGKANGFGTREIMIDNKSAQKIIDLLAGDTEWNDATDLKIEERFDTYMQEPKFGIW